MNAEGRAKGLLLLLALGWGTVACVPPAVRPVPDPPVAPAPVGPVTGVVRYPELEAAQVKNIHLYRGKPLCQACHVPDSERLRAGPVGSCVHCHQVPHSPGHEAGTLLVRKHQVALPLVAGRVVCHTCHDPHDVKRERFGLRKNLNALCLDCHPGH